MMTSSSLKEWLPAIFMVMLQIFTTGSLMLVKVVVDGGLFVCTLLTYRYLLGAVLVVPFAVSFENLGKLKELKLKAFIWIFTSALVGFTVPGLYYIGLGDTSPGYAINFYNIVPIAAFILASQMLKVFPYKYWSTVATCFVGCIQMAIIGVAMNREKATWKLKWNMSLLTIIYSVTIPVVSDVLNLMQAILNTAAKFVMISWVVTQRGPTYPSMFCAVSMLFTTILDSLLLGHDLSVGRKEVVPETTEKPKEEVQFQTGDRTSELSSNV
uniref:WAT1-related protein n=1 Tax=Oryza glumipatula TaxID=40148 RepID=A0A0E0B8W2_9ORYZ